MGSRGKLTKKPTNQRGITGISVRGFKSLLTEKYIEFLPLTILAGANSSGKSSIMQPLLMMKQTLDENYDPGDLLIDGPNVKFNSASNFLSMFGDKVETEFEIRIDFDNQSIAESFKKGDDRPVELTQSKYINDVNEVVLSSEMSEEDLKEKYPGVKEFYVFFSNSLENMMKENQMGLNDATINDLIIAFHVLRRRCFLRVVCEVYREGDGKTVTVQPVPLSGFGNLETVESYISDIMHVPATRGNPERAYKTTAIGPRFPGTMDNYMASIIHHWKITNDPRLNRLSEWLCNLGLTCEIDTKKVTDNQVEILVHRLTRSSQGNKDMVNIVDAGFGVNQILPVLVSLLIAKSEQLVYIEQPEVHLHPKAQYELANIIIEAVNSGIKVVIETHSILLLTGIQTLIAEGDISEKCVKLHWFSRKKNGETRVTSANFDKEGAFGDCPIDFADITLEADTRYLNASE
ncbi:MAG: AAA family ATPase [Methanocella sp.]